MRQPIKRAQPMTRTNLQIVLASRPERQVTPQNFRAESQPVPALTDGQVLVRNRYLSLDPYMRGRMAEAKSYAAPQPLGVVMQGATAGQIVESKHPSFAVGDHVTGMLGWQLYGVSDGRGLQKVDTTHIPLSAYIGVVGMPGATAYYGLHEICRPKAGETVLVSAAAGAVGSVVGQLAKLHGCRAIGVAGGAEKCAHVVNELGFDACIDYKAGALMAQFRAAAPQGIDCLFENVGGEVFDTSLANMNAFGRIALCGMISGYDGEHVPLKNVGSFLINRLSMRGFIIAEHLDAWPRALGEIGKLVATKQLKYRETIAHGLRQAPAAFIGLLKGQNLGKQLVELNDDA